MACSPRNQLMSGCPLVYINDGNNSSIPPTLDGWVYIEPIHGPLYTWAQYTPTVSSRNIFFIYHYVSFSLIYAISIYTVLS